MSRLPAVAATRRSHCLPVTPGWLTCLILMICPAQAFVPMKISHGFSFDVDAVRSGPEVEGAELDAGRPVQVVGVQDGDDRELARVVHPMLPVDRPHRDHVPIRRLAGGGAEFAVDHPPDQRLHAGAETVAAAADLAGSAADDAGGDVGAVESDLGADGHLHPPWRLELHGERPADETGGRVERAQRVDRGQFSAGVVVDEGGDHPAVDRFGVGHRVPGRPVVGHGGRLVHLGERRLQGRVAGLDELDPVRHPGRGDVEHLGPAGEQQRQGRVDDVDGDVVLGGDVRLGDRHQSFHRLAFVGGDAGGERVPGDQQNVLRRGEQGLAARRVLREVLADIPGARAEPKRRGPHRSQNQRGPLEGRVRRRRAG